VGNVTLPKSGYDLAAKILETHPNDAIETMLRYSNGAECDWLEFKAGMTLLPEAVKKHETLDDLYWDYLLSIIAMANTRGGAFIIGVKDKTHEVVPLESCDTGHVIEKRGKEAYLREVVVNNLDRPERKWTTKDRVVWSIPRSVVPFLDKRIRPYNGTDVIVLLVPPREIGEEIFVTSKSGLGEFEHLPVRDMGEIGHVKRLTKDKEFADHRTNRGKQLLSPQFGAWWTELDAEANVEKEDAALDAAIRAYYVKLEENTRKRLQAFVPLDAAGTGESDDDEEIEYEDPTAISVFDEDEETIDGDGQPGSSRNIDAVSDDDDELDGSDSDDEDDNDTKEPQTIRMGLSELLAQYDRVILSGEPGAGKTTCLAHFAIESGKKQGDRPHLFAFVQLGRWANSCGILDLVADRCGFSLSQIEALLVEKRLHLILDALNECPDHLRLAAVESIRALVRKHPDLPVVLSSRKADGLRLPDFPIFEVQAMDRAQQRQFLERYLRNAEKAAAVFETLAKQVGGASIAQNPMLLSMVVDVVRDAESLPSGRATLYRQWLEKWYALEEKKAKKARDTLSWTAEEAIQLLARMAFAGRAEGYRDVPLDIARRSLNDSTALEKLCQGPLLEIEDDVVHFRHETFQEYLCAEWLLTEPGALNDLPMKDYDTWGMPIAYAAELCQPGKFSKELSSAVWEMNPWMAALTTEKYDIPSFVVGGQACHCKLASLIANGSDLLDPGLDGYFIKEIQDGSLFLRADPPLTYLVYASRMASSLWEAFECAYALRFPRKPKAGSKIFRKIKNGKVNFNKKVVNHKKARFLMLNRGNLLRSMQKHFPTVPLGVTLILLTDWFINFSSPRRILNLFDDLNLKSLLPIEVFFRCLDIHTTQSQLDDLFGIDSIPKALKFLSNHPNAASLPKTIGFINKFYGVAPNLARSACAAVLKSEFSKMEELFNSFPDVSISREMQVVFCQRLYQLMVLYGGNCSASELIGTISTKVQHFLYVGGFQCILSPPTLKRLFYRREDLVKELERRQIECELKNVDFEMVVRFLPKDKGYLFFAHPSFPDNVYCPARSTKYQDVFDVGQTWSVKVKVGQNKKDGTWGFIAHSVEPSNQNPVCAARSRKAPSLNTSDKSWTAATSVSPVNATCKPLAQKPVFAIGSNDRAEVERSISGFSHASHFSIYIDETWPGTQDHAYKDVGVIGGIVVPWEGIDEKRLLVLKTHLSNGSVARSAIQTMLSKPDVFPFVFPIKWDRAVSSGGRQYFELVQHALMLLLGWMLPQRDRLTTVDIYLEHIAGFKDGHDETDFINSLTQAMRLLSGGRRFANWQIRRVEWVDKEFGYVPYGDLVCKTCVPHEEQQMLARAVKVREWEGYLPFSKGVFPLLRDMDTASPSGFADLLIAFAKVAKDTPFFRRVRKLAVERARSDTTFRDAVFSRFEACYVQPDRDISLLNRVVPHFLEEFPPDLFKDRPRMQLLRILIAFQHANHNGDPDLVSALVGECQSLRPRVLELDRDLCAYADLNLAVHEHDAFEFDNALALVDGWISDSLFPALSVMNRGRMFSSRGQSLALTGRNQEADEAFARALAQFAAEPELLAKDIEQTKTYQVMNALDQDAPSAVPLLEELLGKSLIAAALDFTSTLERPFVAHLFLKALWRMRTERSVVLDALLKNLPAEIAIKDQHPYELILFYLALLTKDANPAYAQARAEELEQFFETIEFGGTLGLIHAYIRVMLKSHGFGVVSDRAFLDELGIVEQYLPKADTIINKLRAGWADSSMSVGGILPFNYC